MRKLSSPCGQGGGGVRGYCAHLGQQQSVACDEAAGADLRGAWGGERWIGACTSRAYEFRGEGGMSRPRASSQAPLTMEQRASAMPIKKARDAVSLPRLPRLHAHTPGLVRLGADAAASGYADTTRSDQFERSAIMSAESSDAGLSPER